MADSVALSEQRLSDHDVEAIDHLRDVYDRLRQELGRVIVGHREVIERLSICLFARGHALLMGVPGLAKTLLVSKVAETMSLKFSRIQFTPDLMPMDITGTDILQEAGGGRRDFEFIHSPQDVLRRVGPGCRGRYSGCQFTETIRRRPGPH